MPKYDTKRWSRDINGYAICPGCGAMIHQQMVEYHANVCPPYRALESLRHEGGNDG
jgi:acetyl-CoA carboxylase beta subunit